ncbi:transient receptor potential cation channel subfamily a member 1-like [Gigaspora margarita]|uniref:Transient receptor potential cation channel subfamily a member 1-like n=1 Tax=Gigaspora margarita TaxID=4874 RepID=A0A8H3X440_GIGMA|nr:transient receptor potential cation channel subfamily a member 1-like [Gigaspora margarita]
MFPLPNFVTYYENDEDDSFFKKLFKPKSSHFINIDDLTFYSTWNGEALINFKWNTFGKKYYFAIWIIYLVFSEYFESLWNYIDLGAIIPAIVTSVIWLINGSVSTGAIIFTALLLELKFIIYLRVIRYFGIYLALILNTKGSVVSFLLLFGLIILAFVHSLHLLLRSEIFQDSGTNMFKQPGSAIIATYYMMITGDSTPVSEWVSNEDIIIMALMMFFSFFILTYLMNLFIGILSNLLGDNRDNKYSCLFKIKKREIELFYLLPSQKKSYKWFPYTFYFSVHISELRKFINDINSDNWEESTKPIITKIMKILKYEKQESEADKIHKIHEKQESDANKIHNIYENQKSEADKIQIMPDKIQKICEKQESEADKIQKMCEKQENFQKLLEKIMKKLEIQSLEEHND